MSILTKHTVASQNTDVVALSPVAILLLSEIGKSGVRGAALSKELLNELISCGVVEDTITYDQFKKNIPLNRAMTMYIAMSLSDNITESSMYGLGLVSHFDLYFNMSTDKKLNLWIRDSGIDPSRADELKQKRQALYAVISRAKQNTIDNFELMGSPDRTQTVTKQTVKAKMNDQIKRAAQVTAANESGRHAEDIEDIDATEATESSNSSMIVYGAATEGGVVQRPLKRPNSYNDTSQVGKDFSSISIEEKTYEQQKKTLEWVVRRFQQVQTGQIGVAYYYHPGTNVGYITPLSTENANIHIQNPETLVFQNVRTPEEMAMPFGAKLPKKRTLMELPIARDNEDHESDDDISI